MNEMCRDKVADLSGLYYFSFRINLVIFIVESSGADMYCVWLEKGIQVVREGDSLDL